MNERHVGLLRIAMVAMLAGALLACNFESSVGAVPGSDGGTRPDTGSTVDATRPPPPTGCVEVATAPPIQHLTPGEWRRAIVDLGLSARVDLPETPRLDYRATLPPSLVFVGGIDVAARAAAADAAADPMGTIGCAAADRPCVEAALRSLAERAYRRPLTAADQFALDRLYASRGPDTNPIESLEVALHGILLSPDLLFLPERGTGAASGNAPLTDHEVASRLSFTLTGSLPDAELRAAAHRGELRTEAQIASEARRILASPGVDCQIARFYERWLGIDRLDEGTAAVSPELGARMQDETRAFVLNVVYAGDRRLSTLLTAPRTFVDDQLAMHYGFAARPGAELALIDLPADRYASVLTQGAVLAAHPTPTHRGILMREALYCQPLPPPPPDVEVDPPGPETPPTRREQYAAMSAEPACAGCHTLIDPLGFGLESFDEAGRYRAMDNGFPIDDSWEIVDRAVMGTGAVELAARLAGEDDVLSCHGEHYLRNAVRRQRTPEDDCTVQRIFEQTSAADGDVIELVVATVSSEGFRHRDSFAPATTPLFPMDTAVTPAQYAIGQLSSMSVGLSTEDRRALEQYLDALRELSL